MSAYLKTICDSSYIKPVNNGDFDACKEQGECASDQAYRRDQNPYPPGTGEFDSWDFGWCNSFMELGSK